MNTGEFTTVANLPDDMIFVSDSQDTEFIKEYYSTYTSEGETFENDYDSFFVVISDGDYTEIYGMYGIIPYLNEEVCKIL